MKKFLPVLVFAVGLMIKAVTVFGAESSSKVVTKTKILKPNKVSTASNQVAEEESNKEGQGKDSSEMRIQNNITFGQVSGPVDNNNNKATNTGTSSTAEIKGTQSNGVGLSLIPRSEEHTSELQSH